MTAPSSPNEHPIHTRIRTKLLEALAPVELDIIDDSHRHAGHAGAAPGGGTHYTVKITADAFAGLNRVARQRKVYDALGAEFKDGLHALSITAHAPGER
jgi:BolA protein